MLQYGIQGLKGVFFQKRNNFYLLCEYLDYYGWKRCFHILCKGSMAYFFLTRIRYAVVSCYLHERIAHVKIGIHFNYKLYIR